jgi:gamma-glutamyltranspeptidase/glutathione hydrolase
MGDWHSATTSSNKSELVEKVDPNFVFNSRRSPVLCRHACVATSQPLATSVGLDLLRQGANAADVSVAIAAVLAVVEPCSTGLGGDMFCLYYDAKEKQVFAVNGSGCAPKNLTLDKVWKDCPKGAHDFKFSPHAVTVPGAARGWEDTLKRHGSGKFTFAQLLEPAALLAEEGFPVSPVTAHHWASGKEQLAMWIEGDAKKIPMTVNGSDTPKVGEIFSNPDMAGVLRELGAKGATAGFYGGRIGQAIVDGLQKHGGIMTLDDLKDHTSVFPEAISEPYREARLWQVPPNGQGIAALIGLAGLNHLEKNNLCPALTPATVAQTAASYHVQIEMMRLGFADARQYVTCPKHTVSTDWLMDPKRIGERAELRYDSTKAQCHEDDAIASCDTVSFQVVDAEGNAISFVNSNFMGFGTGLVPDGCGFTLQNRGFNFSLDAKHANCLAPGKRPYHTIIPAMLTRTDECTGDELLYATLSNMGGFMQPQGHMQLTVNMLAGGMNPQAAIDTPRFCIPQGTHDGTVELEEGIDDSVLEGLNAMGHRMDANISGHARSTFGRAQIIKKDPVTGVLWAGSDGRADGCALGF